MKLMHRYIISEFIPPTFLALLLFTFVLTIQRIFDFMNLLISKGVNFVLILRLFGYILPSILVYSIPMAVLGGTLLCFGRLSSDNEIVGCEASGISPYRIFHPVLSISLLVSLLMVSFNQHIVPRSYTEFRKLYYEILHRNPVIKLEERTFLEIKDYLIYVQKIKQKKGKLSGIIMYEVKKGGFPTLITAREGNMIVEGDRIVFRLFNGSIQKKEEENPDKYSITYFKTYDFTLDLSQIPPPISTRAKQMEKKELLNEIDKLRRQSIPTNSLEVEYHQRKSIAFAPFAFALIGIPLGIKTKHRGKSVGLGLSLVLSLIYWFLLVEGIMLGQRGIIPPALSVWIPNFLIGLAGLRLIFKTFR